MKLLIYFCYPCTMIFLTCLPFVTKWTICNKSGLESTILPSTQGYLNPKNVSIKYWILNLQSNQTSTHFIPSGLNYSVVTTMRSKCIKSNRKVYFQHIRYNIIQGDTLLRHPTFNTCSQNFLPHPFTTRDPYITSKPASPPLGWRHKA